MKRLAAWIALGLGLLLAAVGTASAGGFSVAEQSALAGGTAGASTARDDDAGAAWYNPAALADGGGLRFGLGMLAAMPSIHAQAMDGTWQTDADSGVSTPPQLGASYAAGNLAVGFFAGVPFGGGVAWPEDWAGRHEIISSQIEVFRVAPFASWRLGNLRVSAGIHADFGRMRIRRSLDFVDTDGDVRIDMDGRSYGFDLAAWYRATPELSLGASYKSRDTLDLQGGADFTAPDAFSMKTADQNVSTTLHLPDRISVGARWARGKLALLGDIDVTTWSVYDKLVIDFANAETPDPVQTTAWQTTVGVRAGAEYALRPATTLRAGAFVDPSPAPSDNLAPSSPDSTRFGGTVGVSHRFRRDLTLDAFYELMMLRGRSSDSMNDLAARYSGHAQMLGLGLRLHR